METEEFKVKVRNVLQENGILVNDSESIFGKTKVIQNETDNDCMLVGPRQEAWVYLSRFMADDEINKLLQQFVKTVRDMVKPMDNISINPAISLKEFIEALAKLLDGSVPQKDLATTSISELISSIEPAK